MTDKKEEKCDHCLWMEHYRGYCVKKNIEVTKYFPACQYFLKRE